MFLRVGKKDETNILPVEDAKAACGLGNKTFFESACKRDQRSCVSFLGAASDINGTLTSEADSHVVRALTSESRGKLFNIHVA